MTDTRKRTGPPLSITPERTAAICTALAEGLSREDAAEEAGIHRCTLYEWLQRGGEQLARRDAGDALDEEQERLLAFYLAVKVVVRGRKRERLHKIASAETATELARDTYLLEQFAPDEFGRRSRHEITGKDGGAIEHTATVRVIALPPLEDAASEDRGSVAGESGPTVSLPLLGR